jgi:polysaccharide pyruvyl transferase CsaB
MSPIQATSSSLPIIVNGYYGYDNLGDEAILESIIQWFATRDDVHPVVMSSNPKATADAYGVDAFPRANLWHLIRRLPGSPVILQGGGGLLQDVTSARSLAYYLSIQLAGFVTGRRVVIFAQGIGPLEGEFSPWFVGGFLSHCDLVILRDFTSYSFAQARMPVDADIRLMGDAALTLEPADPDHIDDIFLQENLDLLEKPLFAFALKGSIKDRRQITSLARAIDIAYESLDCGIALFPFHHPSDVQYAEAIRDMVKEKDYCSVVKGKYRPAEVLGLIGKCDLVVGMRLHSLVFAASRGIPFVPVSYDPKIDEFAGEFGMKPAVHTPLIGPERLVEAIEDAWEFRGRIKTRVTQGMARLRQRTMDGYNALGEYFDRLELRKLGLARTAKKRSKKKQAGSPGH